MKTTASAPPLVTVALPVHNAARWLRECIDSVLSQTFTRFELLVADDGSTDEGPDIVRSYADPRIRLVTGRHDYIATLNRLVDEARGRYIARMDADDVMLPRRLEWQYEYMEAHPEVSVLGGGVERFGAASGTLMLPERVSLHDLVDRCCVAHPTVMLRRADLVRHGLRYEAAYVWAEDYRLWVEALKHGLRVRNLQRVVLRYRCHDAQVSHARHARQQELSAAIRDDAMRWLRATEAAVAAERPVPRQSQRKLTVVIPFLNEGEEVGRTVRSALDTARGRVEVVVVNDDSDDGYDYEADLAGLPVTYVRNRYRIGAAASKEKGVQCIATPYFLLLDAHMRFYDDRWPDRIVGELEADDHRLLCCQTKVLHKEADGRVHEVDSRLTRGAYALFERDEYIPGIRWNTWPAAAALPGNDVACVLGAGYAASRRYWNRLHGLEGLIHYGCEEAYISLKTWLEGGRCRLLPDVVVGHIYRTTPPYRINSPAMHYNNLLISETLFPTSLRCWANAAAFRKSRSVYAGIRFRMGYAREEVARLRAAYRDMARRSFADVLVLNDIVTPEKAAAARDMAARLPDIARALTAGPRPDLSLWEGEAARLLALAEYASYADDAAADDAAGRLLDRLGRGLQGELPVSLAHGLCGIGWALLYLVRNGLAADGFETELHLVDRLVQERSPLRTADLSLATGLGGVLCYVVNRLAHSRLRSGDTTAAPFDAAYLDELDAAARRMLDATDCFRCHSFALQFLCRNEPDWTILPPQLEDVVDLPTFLPKDAAYWQNGLAHLDGYAIHLVRTLRNIKEKGYSFL